MPAPQIILDLVQRFHDSRDLYRSGHYNEAQLRREFLDPFFTALGWDMTNAQNYAPQYREVIQEDTLEIEGQAKAPDYALGIFGVQRMLELNKCVPNTPQEQDLLNREIAVTDTAIDRLVYKLYGLTQEEIESLESN